KQFISNLISDIQNKNKNREELIKSIELIGEPLIRDRLKELLDRNFPKYQGDLNKIDSYIKDLEEALKNAKEIKSKLK
ncbi:MAG: hypothetical protein ACK4IX_13320, partial [Candidatus Sericytochromatia bacterium]